MLMGVTSWELGVLRVPLIMVPDICVMLLIILDHVGLFLIILNHVGLLLQLPEQQKKLS
jgi:hypothetical protein